MSGIYTRTGDKGTTATYAGERLTKDDPRIVVAGLLDSLQSGIDMALLHVKGDHAKILNDIQAKLWQTAGEISLCGIGKQVQQPITEEDVYILERAIDALGPSPTRFVRFSTPASVFLNEARVRCRALESGLTPFLRAGTLRKEVYTYLNRLSDLLFMLAVVEQQ